MFSPKAVRFVCVLKIVSIVHPHGCPGRDSAVSAEMDTGRIGVYPRFVDKPHRARPFCQIGFWIVDIPVGIPRFAGKTCSLIIRVEK